MIVLDRRVAGRFRTAVRRCVVGRPRGLAPPVVLEQDAAGLRLSATLDEVTLALRVAEAAGPPARLVLPFSALAALEGTGQVTLEASPAGGVCCRWSERGDPKEVQVAALASAGELPSLGQLQVVDASLLAALHACGQTASREAPIRYALQRLQLRGQAGQVVGSDGHQLLLWGGFTLPFREDLLIPALPLFGSKEFVDEHDVRLGRTADRIVLAVGPWTVWLTVDGTGRYPDVAAVLPRAARLSRLVLDPADATALLKDLQERLATADEVVPVVLDLGERPAVCWPAGTPGRRGPCNLVRSTCTGPPRLLRLDSQQLTRALALGLREVCATASAAPVLFRDAQRSYLVAACEAIPAPRQALPAPLSTSPRLQGDEEMNSNSNGTPPPDVVPSEDLLDPLVEAEALRTALAEVGRRVGRLITSLRQFQRQRRALHTVWNNLKSLRLGAPEEP